VGNHRVEQIAVGQLRARQAQVVVGRSLLPQQPPHRHPHAGDDHYLFVSKLFTAAWGGIAVSFALFANLVENLIQATNILASIFYGVVLGLFLVAFFLKRIGGTAVFWAAAAAQLLVFALYFTLPISYLWYNVIGCAACVLFAVVLQPVVGPGVTTTVRPCNRSGRACSAPPR